jgi:hypothetical protein
LIVENAANFVIVLIVANARGKRRTKT